MSMDVHQMFELYEDMQKDIESTDERELANFSLEAEEDVVNKPSHYKGMHGLEVQEIIENYVPDPYSAHFKDALKYLLRHLNKGNPKRDLEKCRYYVNKMLEDWDK